MKSKLQEEILQAIQTGDGILDESRAYHASKVSLKWIIKAFRAGSHFENHSTLNFRDAVEVWLKENNLIEKQ